MKDCKFCDKQGLLILPLRYAAVVGDKGAASLPALPGTLGKHVSDLAIKAKYAPRMLRQGFLYVLINRAGVLYWEGYASTDDGFLYKFPVEAPPQAPVAFSCNRDACGVDASMLAIDKVDTVKRIYLLFAPTAMTLSMLDQYKNNAEAKVAKGKMQAFDPKAWVGGNHQQQHSMAPELLNQHVPEMITHHQYGQARTSPLGEDLQDQLFKVTEDALFGAPPFPPDAAPAYRLGALVHKMRKQKAAAFVVFDHIGITQELNNYRNAALEPLNMFLAKKDAAGIDNDRRLQVMQAIDDVQDGYVRHGMGIAKRQIEMMEGQRFRSDAGTVHMMRISGRNEEADALEKAMAESEAERERNKEKMLSGYNAKQEWTRKYESLLNVSEKETFRNTLQTISSTAHSLAAARRQDHALWVTSDRLVDAFDIFDPEALNCGFSFNVQHSACTFGMFGQKDNADILSKWMDISTVERNNLYMRANLFNDKEFQEQAGKAFAEARKEVAAAGELAQVSDVPWMKAAKGLIDTAKKVDSAWDEWLRDKVVKTAQQQRIDIVKAGGTPPPVVKGGAVKDLSAFHRSAEAMLFSRISEWTQAVSKQPGKMDKAISGVVGMLIYSRLDSLTRDIAFTEYMGKLGPEMRAKVEERRAASTKARKRADEKRHAAQIDKANRKANELAAKMADADVEKIEKSIDELLDDEQKKVRNKVEVALKEMDDPKKRPTTNNFHQARLGMLLIAIEALSLTGKLTDPRELNIRRRAEIGASLMSLTSMSIDVVYSTTKSLREIGAYEKVGAFQKAADYMRGGMKLTSGALSAIAGVLGALFDLDSARKEAFGARSADRFLLAVYVSRASTGLASAYYGWAAARSYSGPLLRYIEAGLKARGVAPGGRLVAALASRAVVAEGFVASRTFMLLRLARLNMIGLAITAAEIGYRCFIKDDELENWCQACTFRKDKSTGLFSEKPFASSSEELKALEMAYQEITS